MNVRNYAIHYSNQTVTVDVSRLLDVFANGDISGWLIAPFRRYRDWAGSIFVSASTNFQYLFAILAFFGYGLSLVCLYNYRYRDNKSGVIID